ncbi:MAG: FeoB small GTPase domain-containing protein [[Clostridium] symbiosum]
MSQQKLFTIGLAGTPNVGKSTIFNALTKMHQHTGNWSGKTVACCSGQFHYKDVSCLIVDLPGTYSLRTHSEEEEIAREYIVSGEPDLLLSRLRPPPGTRPGRKQMRFGGFAAYTRHSLC